MEKSLEIATCCQTVFEIALKNKTGTDGLAFIKWKSLPPRNES